MTDTTPRGVEVQHLDPRSLLVDVNVRRDAQVDKEFVASVRDLGVLVPIVAVRIGDGGVRVRFGHRRVLAAMEAERHSVPVVVVADEGTTPLRRSSGWSASTPRTSTGPACPGPSRST